MSLAATTGGGLGGAGAGAGMAMAHHAGGGAQVAVGAPQAQFSGAGATASSGVPSNLAALGADLVDKSRVSAKQSRNTSHLPICSVDLYNDIVYVGAYTAEGPALIGKLSSTKLLASEGSHKTLRKWLNKTKTFEDVAHNSLGTTKTDVDLLRPQELLGCRTLSQVPKHLDYQKDTESSAFAQARTDVGVTLITGSVDGPSPADTPHDERVVMQVRLHESKKPLTLLPQEATALLLHEAQRNVSTEEEEDVPLVIAVPNRYFTDAGMEALHEAVDASTIVHPRPVCALFGALLVEEEHALWQRLIQVYKAAIAEAQRQQTRADDKQLLLLQDDHEVTAIEIGGWQRDEQPLCPFERVSVVATTSTTEGMTKFLETYEDEPSLIIRYGTSSKSAFGDEIPVVQLPATVVTAGAAVLGAVAHGRLFNVDGTKKKKAVLATTVRTVAPLAVGVRLSYDGGRSWRLKIVFDQNRRLPAGPYTIDSRASECAMQQEGNVSDDDVVTKAKDLEGHKHIALREQAALQFRMQLVQQHHDGEWVNVGKVESPLVRIDKDESKIACEAVSINLSLGVDGMVSLSLEGDRESVSRATEKSRNDFIKYWIGMLLAVLFFGGFLVKSYWEEHVFTRDTKKLLAYYKHVLPGGIQDGDENSARYIVWKYRNKKAKLWKSLERKYDHPVLEVHEWPEETVTPDEEEETVDMDKEEDSPKEDL